MTASRAREIRAQLAGRTTEIELQATIQQALDLYGWKTHHETDSRRTMAGWPDLFTVHPSGWWAALELKSQTGRISQAQLDWLHAMGWQHGLMIDSPLKRIVGLVYPADLDDVLQVLGNISQ